MAKRRSKRYRECLEKVPDEPVPVPEAVRILKDFKTAKFDSTVELTMWLGIDPRQADQAIRGAISLPNGIGVSRKVVAFCEGDDVEKAKAAGAIEAGGEELVQKVQAGWTDFDIAIATKNMMKLVSRLGRILGPAGKMPSPKAGTVVDNVAQAVKDYSAGKVEYRNDGGGNVAVPVGKVSFEPAKLAENVEAFIAHIRRLRPATVKGVYIRRAVLTATMTPAIHLALA